jgi:hypothetical protein
VREQARRPATAGLGAGPGGAAQARMRERLVALVHGRAGGCGSARAGRLADACARRAGGARAGAGAAR